MPVRRNCSETGSALEIPEEVEGEILSPHQASVLSNPIILVIFSPIDIVMHPNTCSTHALIADLIRLSSLVASLRGC